MKFVSIVGARPQFVKLGPLSREIRKNHSEVIIHTGQHYDHEMSQLFFDELKIAKPDINLEIGSSPHGVQTGQMLIGIEEQLILEKPDIVITFGDTNSTLAACLAASKLQIPSVHVEAGLRSFNRSMPEEINRVVADHTADLLFAPTSNAVLHLKNEGLASKTVLTGDIMVDSVKFIKSLIKKDNTLKKGYYLMTLHRPYNVDNPLRLKLLFKSLNRLKTQILFPIHPRTKSQLDLYNIDIPSNIKLLSPKGYLEFHSLIINSEKVITDSGGLQKEAYLHGKPCITLRSETEWVETVTSGWNLLLEIEGDDLDSKIDEFTPTGDRPKLYGESVAELMVKEIESKI